MKPIPTRLMNRKEAAKRLCISEKTIDRLRYSGTISWCKIGGVVRFAEQDILNYIGRNRVEAKGNRSE